MKLEDQVCSLDLAKQLKSLGAKQESVFFWNYDERGTAPKLTKGRMLRTQSTGSPTWWDVSAFTVTELLNQIPKIIEGHNPDKDNPHNPSYLRIFTDECIAWCVAHSGIEYQLYVDNSDDENLANVMAGMLIHLIEKGIVKI